MLLMVFRVFSDKWINFFLFDIATQSVRISLREGKNFKDVMETPLHQKWKYGHRRNIVDVVYPCWTIQWQSQSERKIFHLKSQNEGDVRQIQKLLLTNLFHRIWFCGFLFSIILSLALSNSSPLFNIDISNYFFRRNLIYFQGPSLYNI